MGIGLLPRNILGHASPASSLGLAATHMMRDTAAGSKTSWQCVSGGSDSYGARSDSTQLNWQLS